MAAKYPEDDYHTGDDPPMDKECGICLEIMRQPKLLPCLHSFCRDCLQEYVQKHSIHSAVMCPLCRAHTQIPDNMADGFDDNIFASGQIVTATEKTKCDACKENPISSSCLECKQYYCTFCSKTHLNISFTKEHHIAALAEDEKMQIISKEYCCVHPTEELGCFCVECEKVICFKCNMITHKHHRSTEIQEVAANRRQELTTFIKGEIEGKKVTEIQAEIDFMKREKAKLESELTDNCKLITAHAGQIKQKVDIKCKEMIDTLRKKTRHRIQEYERKLELLKKQMTSTKQVSEAAKKLTKYAGESEMISKFPTFKAKLDDISIARTANSIEELTQNYVPGVVSDETIGALMGKVDIELKLKKPVTSTYIFRKQHGSGIVTSVCCFEKDSAWFGQDKYLKLLQKDGIVKEEIDMGEKVHDITMDQTGQVFVACEKSVKTLDADRKPRTCFPLPNTPSAVTCTQGDIVVCYQDRAEIIQYTREGKQVKTLNTVRDDGYKVKPYKATFNVNGDLVVSDTSSYDVTVFDVTGKVRTVIRTKKMSPRGVACSDQGQIYVADWDKDRVNMYSVEGHLLQTVIPCKDNGLNGPRGLSLDPFGHLWIGDCSGYVSLYQLSI